MHVVGTAGTQEGMDLVKSQGADEVVNHRQVGYTEGIMVSLDMKITVGYLR